MKQRFTPLGIGLLLTLLVSEPCAAHGFVGSGWLHPLTGTDHMVAMVAVGMWSAQVGGRAIYTTPAAFLGAMGIGAGVGFAQQSIRGTEMGITLSVLLLGPAIAGERNIGRWSAALGMGLFGLCHGYAHGYEMPSVANPWRYAVGFLLTTAGLHVAGAVGGLLVLENRQGKRWLRLAGLVIALVSVYWVFMSLK